jgi:hypothetical protein
MAQFKVVMEITVGAESPLEAAKTIQEWLEDPQSKWQYYVQELGDKKVFSVDLSEEDEDAVLPVEKYEPMIRTK